MATAAAEEEDKVFVAVPAKPWAARSALSWALGHLYGRGTTIVVTHVLVPAQMIPIMGGKFHASKLSPEQVSSFRMKERQKADKMLDDYIHHCSEIKVKCEKLMLEKEDAASGLVELIESHGIAKLVISAAADKHYSRKLNRPTSKTATAVMQRANPSCKIWFVCKEQLIYTRDGVKTAPAVTSPIPSVVTSPTPAVVTSPTPAVTSPKLPDSDPVHGEALDLSTQQEEFKEDEVVEPELGLEEALQETCRAVEKLMKRALAESFRRQKAEEEAALSLQNVKDYEEMYVEEARRRRELEGALARANREIWQLRRQAIQQNGAMEEEFYFQEATTATKTILQQRGGVGGVGGGVGGDGRAGFGAAAGGRHSAGGGSLSRRVFSFIDDATVVGAPYHLDDDGGGSTLGSDEARWWIDAADGMSSTRSSSPVTGHVRRAHPADYTRRV